MFATGLTTTQTSEEIQCGDNCLHCTNNQTCNTCENGYILQVTDSGKTICIIQESKESNNLTKLIIILIVVVLIIIPLLLILLKIQRKQQKKHYPEGQEFSLEHLDNKLQSPRQNEDIILELQTGEKLPMGIINRLEKVEDLQNKKDNQ